MSTVWSIFGMVGAIRAYAKFTAGLDYSEKAGVDLCGASGYTLRKTRSALSACVIGLGSPQPSWQDDQRLLLGVISAENSRWIKPHITVMGYSRCPFESRRATQEIFERLVLIVITVIISCSPRVILRQSAAGDTLDNIALVMAVGSTLIAGCLLPLLLPILNSDCVMHLRSIQTPARFERGISQDGDTVITTATVSTILWQQPGKSLLSRSADRISIRLLSALSACTTIVAYILTYLELGRVPTWKAYSWLGFESFILVFRFFIWAIRPRVFSTRPKSVLFFITGSLAPPLTIEPSESQSNLQRSIVHYAVASAASKLLNIGGGIANLQLEALDLLSDVVPCDILSAKYCDCQELMKMGGKFTAIRLPWSWMEEIYTAQGLVLGRNPWSLGGLYLAAVVQGDTFYGLTTIHPKGATSSGAHGEDDFPLQYEKHARLRDLAGVTADNFGIKDSLVIGTIIGKMPDAHDLSQWHAEFRENVANCRATAVSNGPPHYEIHVRNFGDGPLGNKRMSKTVSTVNNVFQLGLDIAKKEKVKDHSKCKEFCTIFGF
jgi:hypothetical protein